MSSSHIARTALLAASLLLAPVMAGSAVVIAGDVAGRATASVSDDTSEMAVAARGLLDSMGVTKQIDEVLPTLAKSLQQASTTKPLYRHSTINVRDIALKLFKSHRSVILGELAGLYANVFSTAELNSLTAFWTSPQGTRFRTFSATLAANSNADRRKAADETSAALGISTSEKISVAAYMKSAEWQKLIRTQPLMAAAARDVGRKWGAKVGFELDQIARRERASMPGGA